MLTAIREKTQGIIATIILVLVVIPFALWGVNSYFDGGAKINIALVDGQEISQQTYREALDQFRGRADPATLANRKFKDMVLENLIHETLLVHDAENRHYRMSDARLGQMIRQLPYFQRDGKFDPQMYDALLRREGMNPTEFEARLRRETLTGQIQSGFSESAIVTPAELTTVARLMRQERELAFAVISPESQMAKTTVNEKDIEKYYTSNADRFQTPEMVRVDYVRLSAADLNKNYQPNEDDIKKAYAEEASRYVTPAVRRASHILITVPAQATETVAQQALTKIQDVEKQVRAGVDFTTLAKKHSADTTTAPKGGDLGEIRRGMFSKELEETAYALKLGEISKPVRTTFGYHLVKLTALTPEKRKSFNDARPELIELARKRRGEEKFFELAEKFRNLVYEQPDSLAPAAQALGLETQKSDWFVRTGGPGIAANPKLAEAAFAPEVLSQSRNSDAIEIDGETLVAVRVTDRRPASRKPLAEVRSSIERVLKQQQAQDLARQLSEEWLRQLRQDTPLDRLAQQHGVKYQTPKPLTRDQTGGVERRIVEAAFRAPRPEAGKPVYEAVEMGEQGYALVALKAVRDVGADKIDPATVEKAKSLLITQRGADYYANYRTGLRKNAKVKIYSDKF